MEDILVVIRVVLILVVMIILTVVMMRFGLQNSGAAVRSPPSQVAGLSSLRRLR